MSGRTTQYLLELLAECIEALPEGHSAEFLYPEDETRSIVSDTLEPRCVERNAVMNIIALVDAGYKLGREEALGGFDIEDTLERHATDSWEKTLANTISQEEDVESFLIDRFTKTETVPQEQQESTELVGTVAENLEEIHDNRFVGS